MKDGIMWLLLLLLDLLSIHNIQAEGEKSWVTLSRIGFCIYAPMCMGGIRRALGSACDRFVLISEGTATRLVGAWNQGYLIMAARTRYIQ